MSGRRVAHSAPIARNGFTLMEALVYLVFGAIVIGSIHGLMLGQRKDFDRQQNVTSNRANLRQAMASLTAELRPLSRSGGDLYDVASDRIRFRSARATGTVCDIGKSGGTVQLVVSHSGGTFHAEAADSILAYAIGSPWPNDDRWVVLKPTSAKKPGAYLCGYTVESYGEFEVAVQGDTAGLRIGGALRAFQPVEYQLFPDQGQWWLGRRIGNGALERLTGPMLAPASGGLTFSYEDASGSPTTTPADVVAVNITLRAPRPRLPGGALVVDSMRSLVFLRGG